MSETPTTDRRDEALLLALGGVTDVDVLKRIVRKAQRRITSLGGTPVGQKPATKAVDTDKLTAGAELIIGSENGQQTRVKVVTVNRKRVKVELLEARGTRKPQAAGTVISIYPDLIREVVADTTDATSTETDDALANI